jgi:hypothetical protein
VVGDNEVDISFIRWDSRFSRLTLAAGVLQTKGLGDWTVFRERPLSRCCVCAFKLRIKDDSCLALGPLSLSGSVSSL